MKEVKRNFLKEFLKYYPNVPGLSLFRGVEARLLSGIEFVPPVLDLGCGDGSFSRVFFNGGKVAAGVDIDEHSIKAAEQLDIYQDLKIADVASLPWEDASFGTIFSNCVLEHIQEFKLVLKEAFRVLKKGGKFIATVPSDKFTSLLYSYSLLLSRNQTKRAEEFLENFNFRHRHYNYLSPDEWKNLLTETGFSMIEIDYYLSPEATTLWSKLEYLYTCELSGILNSLKGRMITFFLLLMPRFILNLFWEKYLRSSYQADVIPPEKGGGLLIIARK